MIALTPVPVIPLSPPPATAAVWTPDPAKNGKGNCHACRGTGERGAGATLFCDRCGGSGDFGPGPQRVLGPDGRHVTLYGPVPGWLAAAITSAQ
jgi:hypothetical protein